MVVLLGCVWRLTPYPLLLSEKCLHTPVLYAKYFLCCLTKIFRFSPSFRSYAPFPLDTYPSFGKRAVPGLPTLYISSVPLSSTLFSCSTCLLSCVSSFPLFTKILSSTYILRPILSMLSNQDFSIFALLPAFSYVFF